MAFMSCCHVKFGVLFVLHKIGYRGSNDTLRYIYKSAQIVCIRGISLLQLMAIPLSRNQTCEKWLINSIRALFSPTN